MKNSWLISIFAICLIIVIAFLFAKIKTPLPEKAAAGFGGSNTLLISKNLIPLSTPSIRTNKAFSPVISNLVMDPQEAKMKNTLAQYNNPDIVFYGKLVDQFGNAISDAKLKIEITFNNGQDVGIKRTTSATDASGFFTLSGYKGESLSVVPVKSGYAMASLNGGGVYSLLWPEAQRVHPDPYNPVIMKMWKLEGAEPLIGIGKSYKIPYSANPIYFDLVAGQIVSNGGDLKIMVNRPQGMISQQHPQNWSIALNVINGGLIETDSKQFQITYAAPEDGYQPTKTATNDNGSDGTHRRFFVKSRNGQIYSKLGLTFLINDDPNGLMYVEFTGIANTNASRNWEGDPNTLKNAGH